MADTSWILEVDVLADIRKTFVNSAAIYRRLQTSNKVWEPKFVAGKGAKYATANKIATLFLGVLRDVLEDTPNVDGIHLGMARHLGENKYADKIGRGLDTSDMVVQRVVQELAAEAVETAPGLATVTPIHARPTTPAWRSQESLQPMRRDQGQRGAEDALSPEGPPIPAG